MYPEMYPELLKQMYYQERSKLESMWIYKQESKFRFLQLKKTILEKIGNNLTIAEILGRADIQEEVKDSLLRDGRNEDKFKGYMQDMIDKELSTVEDQEKEELKNAHYSPEEFADYLFQLEKVTALEDAISELRFFPEEVFTEQKLVNERK